MKKKIFSLMIAAMFLMVGIVSAAEIQGGGYIEVSETQYFVQGKSLNELRRMAEMRAYRKLSEELGDLHISSTTIMKDETLDDEIKVAVEKTVRGAKIISNVRDSEGNFTATVRLNLFGGTNSIANIVIPKDTSVKPFPSFNPKFITMDTNYTGLIIDCGGQLTDTAMLPKIISASGKEIYAFKYLDRNMVITRGMAAYSDSADSGVQRAGNNPLTVQGMVMGGCDVTVSDEDAEKILAANSKSNFLKNCMVVFVK